VAARRYPGTCRQRGLGDGPGHSLRARIPDGVVEFDDRFQGPYRIDAAARIGDVIVRRADGLIAYHLASVTDDHALGATHIVRGADLLDASAVQRCLQRALAFRSTALAHVPMAVDDKGRKLSKSCGAEPALLRARPAALLASVLDFLGQEPGPDLATLPVPDVIDWAISHWSGDRVPRLLTKQPVWPREAGT
jgi:glutamyl-Q tRNA(Asp) synthetase